MSVPKTPMHEYHLAAAPKNQIGFTGQVFAVQPVAVAHAVYKAAHDHFRFHPCAFNLAHVFAAPLGSEIIHLSVIRVFAWGIYLPAILTHPIARCRPPGVSEPGVSYRPAG